MITLRSITYNISVISVINEVFNCFLVLNIYSRASIFLHFGNNHELILLVKSRTIPNNTYIFLRQLILVDFLSLCLFLFIYPIVSHV